MAGKKLSRLEFLARVRTVQKLRLGGASIADMRQFASQPHDLDGVERPAWRASYRAFHRYLAAAAELTRRQFEANAKGDFAYQVMRRERLYAHMMEVGDYNGALQVCKDHCHLVGHYDRDWADRLKAVEDALGIRRPEVPTLAGGEAPPSPQAPAAGGAGPPRPDVLPGGPGGLREGRPSGDADPRPAGDPPEPP